MFLFRRSFVALVCLLMASAGLANICEVTEDRPENSMILAMDLSASMDAEERAVQLRGYADSLRDPQVVSNLLECTCTEIAVVFWGSSARVEVDLKLMKTKEDIDALANYFEQLSQSSAYDIGSVGEMTMLYDALEFSSNVLQEKSQSIARKSIVISGDGYDTRLYANLEKFRDLKDSNFNTGVEVHGVPIDIPHFMVEAQPLDTPSMTATVDQGNNQTQLDYPEVSDFYKDEVVTPYGLMSVAENSQGLEDSLTKLLTQLTCRVSM